ncbi:hypothetical protein [Plantactinospora sonchi]|uniref:Uncharacterized protein n=1 Tax=Plantactinospora sonchi TaxID=1544735 RepID=A0ABU7RT81_9ACTN
MSLISRVAGPSRNGFVTRHGFAPLDLGWYAGISPYAPVPGTPTADMRGGT